MAAMNRRQSNFKRFLNENKTLIFTSPLLAVLVIVVVILYAGPGGAKKPESVPAMAQSTAMPDGNRVQVLPQTERDISANSSSKGGTSGDNAARDPFNGPASLIGILTGDDGNNVAVVEADGKSYIVKKGDIIGGNTIVEEISADEIKLKDNDTETTLKLEPRKDSQDVSK